MSDGLHAVLFTCRHETLFVQVLCVFVFKQKTAYEMRISDWSSDVCSSDLLAERQGRADHVAATHVEQPGDGGGGGDHRGLRAARGQAGIGKASGRAREGLYG